MHILLMAFLERSPCSNRLLRTTQRLLQTVRGLVRLEDYCRFMLPDGGKLLTTQLVDMVLAQVCFENVSDERLRRTQVLVTSLTGTLPQLQGFVVYVGVRGLA